MYARMYVCMHVPMYIHTHTLRRGAVLDRNSFVVKRTPQKWSKISTLN